MRKRFGSGKSEILNLRNAIIYTLLFLAPYMPAFSQANIAEIHCGTDAAISSFFAAHPEEEHAFNEFNLAYQDMSFAARETAEHTYLIPVVFHVFGTEYNGGDTITDDIIIDALYRTNEDFQGLAPDWNSVSANFDSRKTPLDIEFVLASIDPDGNPTTGITYHEAVSGFGHGGGYDGQIQMYAWDNYRYMNIYIMRDLYDDGDFYNSGVAWYPSSWMSDNNLARVVYNGSYLGSNTSENFRSVLTHEFGHWLNLIHPFEGGCSGLNDHVDDTPATTSNSGTCNSTIELCSGAGPANGENFMDYSECYKMFTLGQVDRMIVALENHPARNGLWQRSNLLATGVIQDGAFVSWSARSFEEGLANDGTIGNTVTATLNDRSFSENSGTLLENVDYTVTNIPPGLTLSVLILDTLTAELSLSGTAANHTEQDDVETLNFSFLDPALEGGSIDTVFFTHREMQIRFRDPYTVRYYDTFEDADDLSVDSNTPWVHFVLEDLATMPDYGLWIDDGDLRLETYTQPLVCNDDTRNITPLSFGTVIGSTSNWVAGGVFPDEHDLRTDSYTEWDGLHAFIGFKFNFDDLDHYGWFRCKVNPDGSAYTLYDYAYSSEPFGEIRAGAKSLAGPLTPLVNINGPYEADQNTVLSFSSEATLTNDDQPPSYFWDFGDGNSSTEPDPQHIYADHGMFDVKLIVMDGSGLVDSAMTTAEIEQVIAGQTTIYYEGFENASPGQLPTGWSEIVSSSTLGFSSEGIVNLTDVNSTWPTSPYAGSYSLLSGENWVGSGPIPLRLVMPPINMASVTGITLDFYELRAWDNAWPVAKPTHEIYIEYSLSPDGPWTRLATVEAEEANFRNWQQVRSVDLSELAGSRPYISFYTTTHHYYWRLDDVEIFAITGTNVLAEKYLPEEYFLSQNYPNPFNPITNLKFGLPQSSDVNLMIYDLSGRMVAEIAAGHHDTGVHELQWDGKDRSGLMVSTGLYFTHFKAGDYSRVIKMLYLK